MKPMNLLMNLLFFNDWPTAGVWQVSLDFIQDSRTAVDPSHLSLTVCQCFSRGRKMLQGTETFGKFEPQIHTPETRINQLRQTYPPKSQYLNMRVICEVFVFCKEFLPTHHKWKLTRTFRPLFLEKNRMLCLVRGLCFNIRRLLQLTCNGFHKTKPAS